MDSETTESDVLEKSLFKSIPTSKLRLTKWKRFSTDQPIPDAFRNPRKRIDKSDRFGVFLFQYPAVSDVCVFFDRNFRYLDEAILLPEHLSFERKTKLLLDTQKLCPFEYFSHTPMFEAWCSCFRYILGMAKDPQKEYEIRYILERIEELISSPSPRHSPSITLEDLAKSFEDDIPAILPNPALPPAHPSLQKEYRSLRRYVQQRMAELNRFRRHLKQALQAYEPQDTESFYKGPPNGLSWRPHPRSRVKSSVADLDWIDVPSTYPADSDDEGGGEAELE
jgi:hypothetical protein